MVTVILPGFSSKNKDWAIDAANKINVFHDIRPIFWDHWVDPDKKFDAKEKAGDVIDILLKDSANIVAKSVGTLVASYMIESIPARIQKVIFCGIPLADLTDQNKEIIKNALKIMSPENIICFQNEEDPLGSYKDVEAFISSVNPGIKVIKKKASDHNYPYYEDFDTFLKDKKTGNPQV